MMYRGFTDGQLLQPGLHRFTILPRIQHCASLVESILESIEIKSKIIKIENSHLYDKGDLMEDSLEFERVLYFAHDSLEKVKQRLGIILGINSIPIVLSTAVPLIRATSSKLHGKIPDLEAQLGNLSSTLGSIIVDSASIVEAQVNFKEINLESAKLLDESKLMADSKINKLYPNLELLKADAT